jgi:REP element-mobilizing transposase RayT
MSRSPRVEFPGAIHHVTARANSRLSLYADDVDRERFLETLGRTSGRYRLCIYAYCLMGTHYHLLLETPQPTLAPAMRELNGRFARWVNRRHGSLGHVFQERYHTELVRTDDHLLEVARYVVLNPVRAGLCSSPSAWPWSSFRATIGQVPTPGYLAVGRFLDRFGRDPDAARTAYARFVEEGMAAHRAWLATRRGLWDGARAR